MSSRVYFLDRFEFPSEPPAVADVTLTSDVDVPALYALYAAALHFPDYFGKNWDAFNDCMRDACPPGRSEVVVDHASLPRLDPRDLRTYLEILIDSIFFRIKHALPPLRVCFRPADRAALDLALQYRGPAPTSLLTRFLQQGCDDPLRDRLAEILADPTRDHTELNFDVFDVLIYRSANLVVVRDVLDGSFEGEERVSVPTFAAMLAVSRTTLQARLLRSGAFDVESIRHEAERAGCATFVLPADIADIDSFFAAVRATLPLDPPVETSHWDALSDSLWQGLYDHRSPRLVIWPGTHAMEHHDPEAFSIALEVLASTAQGLAHEGYTVGRPKQVTVIAG